MKISNDIDIIRCRQCGWWAANLYTEDGYQDITCQKCGARTGKCGDENESINLWNGEGVKFYPVIWRGAYGSEILELWDDEETAEKQSKKYNKEISEGNSPMGYKIDLSRGIREICSTEPIEPNKQHVIKKGN
jgi:hypothetical protein